MNTCNQCHKEMANKSRKYCSLKCFWEKRKTNKKWLEHLRNIGYQKGRISEEKGVKKPWFSGENHPNWKGDNVKYEALHEWVRSRFEKPKLCQNCKKRPPYDLANKGIYNRKLKNWEWLCRGCHMKKDGRLKRLIKSGDPTGRKHSKETINKMSLSRKRYFLNMKQHPNFGLLQVSVEMMAKKLKEKPEKKSSKY